MNSLKDEASKNLVVNNYRRQWEWENSLEGVHYNLGIMDVSIDLECSIVKAVQKLPPKIKEFVYRSCVFVSVAKDGGVCYHKRSKGAWLIILGEKVDESIVAHEIAHARLGHKTDRGEDLEATLKTEKQACSLAKEWGFTGPGIEEHRRLLLKTKNLKW